MRPPQPVYDPLKQKMLVPLAAWKFVTLAAGFGASMVVSYILLYADAHNDKRYVRQTSYAEDRRRDKEVRDVMDSRMDERLKAQDKKLDEISGDIKLLLRESRNAK